MGGYQQKGEKPLRNYKNRKRYITVGFRVSPEQRDELYNPSYWKEHSGLHATKRVESANRSRW